jgi:hypothetical protein
MLSRLRNRMSYANVTATLALFFAMSGGALAASHYLITSTKQISPKVLSSLKGANGKAGSNGAQGAPGAQGSQGPQGPAGTNGTGIKGETGGPGSPGSPGANGKSVVAGEEAKGGYCKEGGANFEVEGSGSKVYACNGEGGSGGGGLPKTLPSGATETGYWLMTPVVGAGAGEVAISFPIPLAARFTGEWTHSHFIAPNGLELSEAGQQYHEIASTTCKGSVENPEAAPGNLCVYTSGLEKTSVGEEHVPTFLSFEGKAYIEGVGTAGTVLLFGGVVEGASGRGAWALTAP